MTILGGMLIILACLAVLAVLWYVAYRINIRLEAYRKYRETRARMDAVDESKTHRDIVYFMTHGCKDKKDDPDGSEQ